MADRNQLIRYVLGTISGIAALEFMPRFSVLNVLGLSTSTELISGITINTLLFFSLFIITALIFSGKKL